MSDTKRCCTARSSVELGKSALGAPLSELEAAPGAPKGMDRSGREICVRGRGVPDLLRRREAEFWAERGRRCGDRHRVRTGCHAREGEGGLVALGAMGRAVAVARACSMSRRRPTCGSASATPSAPKLSASGVVELGRRRHLPGAAVAMEPAAGDSIFDRCEG